MTRHRWLSNPKVEDRGYTSPCWIYQGHIAADGYARTSRGGKTKYVHRIYYEKYKGTIPDGLVIDHLCRVRSCLNPEHMRVTTYAQNSRQGYSTILTEKQVLEIRQLLAEGKKQEDIAELYGITQSNISRISTKDCWKTSVETEAIVEKTATVKP